MPYQQDMETFTPAFPQPQVQSNLRLGMHIQSIWVWPVKAVIHLIMAIVQRASHPLYTIICLLGMYSFLPHRRSVLVLRSVFLVPYSRMAGLQATASHMTLWLQLRVQD